MPGTVEKVNVAVGDKVNAGDPLVVMIAMKMEVRTIHEAALQRDGLFDNAFYFLDLQYVIKAPVAGTVKSIFYKEGETVRKGEHLIDFEAP